MGLLFGVLLDLTLRLMILGIVSLSKRCVCEDEIYYLARFSWLSSCLSLCTSANTVSTGGFSREVARGLGVVAAVRVVDVSPGFKSGTLSEELLEGKQY